MLVLGCFRDGRISKTLIFLDLPGPGPWWHHLTISTTPFAAPGLLKRRLLQDQGYASKNGESVIFKVKLQKKLVSSETSETGETLGES